MKHPTPRDYNLHKRLFYQARKAPKIVSRDKLSETEYLGRSDNWKILGPGLGSGSGPGTEIAAAQRAAAADGPGPDLGPDPDIFQLSGRPRYSVPDKFSWSSSSSSSSNVLIDIKLEFNWFLY